MLLLLKNLFCFQGICSIAGCFLSCLSSLRAKMADSKLLVVRCIVLMPFPPHPQLLYLVYMFFIGFTLKERISNFKKNVESAISYTTFWLELMKDFSEQPDKTYYIVFIIDMLFQKLFSQCSESVIDLLIPIECSSASVNKIFVGTIIYIHCSLCLPSPYFY